MKRWPWLRIVVVASCLAPGIALGQGTPEPARNRVRVISLETRPTDSPWWTIPQRIYRQALSDAFGNRLEYYSERLDVYNFPHSSYEAEFEDHLARKYAERQPDLLLVGGETATAVAERLQARFAGHPPIVFQGALQPRPVPKSAGYTLEYGFKESLDLALRVQPETRQVFVVRGAGPVDDWCEEYFRAQLAPPPRGVDITYVRGLPVPELVGRLAALPPHSVVLLLSFTSDREGREVRLTSVIDRLAAASTAPIDTSNSAYVGLGAFGGRLLVPERVADKTIQLAVRILRGERPEDIPFETLKADVEVLDWRQLERWNISEADIPPGVELRFRQPSVFEQHRGYILGAVTVSLLQTALIAGLLVQRRNRRQAENSLRESEERFRVMADTAPVMVWRAGPDQQCDFFNKPWLEFRGRSLRDEIGEGWTEGVHPDDLDRCLSIYRAAWPGRETFRMEYRLRRADGDYRWVIDTGVPRLAADETLVGYIGSCIDITERRQAEEALRANEAALRQSHTENQDLAGRLITAQEAERARIARDLHDDVSQRLAGISICISGCKRRPEMHQHPELAALLNAVQRQTIEVAEDIRLLSHDLHPGALEHAGLVDALRSHCREFAGQQFLEVSVDAEADLTVSDMATSLCLYRIVQEALRNIVKHADARKVRVTVRRLDDDVQLTVSDDGKGFDLARARSEGGLGLRSIDERVRQAGGRLSIETAPRRGTRITVWMKAVARTAPEFAEI